MLESKFGWKLEYMRCVEIKVRGVRRVCGKVHALVWICFGLECGKVRLNGNREEKESIK